MQRITIFFIIIILSSSLLGCATTYDRGKGILISEKKIRDRDYKPHYATKVGAVAGGTTGITIGSFIGGTIGLGFGALANFEGLSLIAPTLVGAGIGALIVGGIGTIAGGGLGYALDHGKSNTGLYEFIVKPENGSKTLTITQYTAPIPIYSTVHILERDNTLFIKPLGCR